MEEQRPDTHLVTEKVVEATLTLGHLALQFGKVDRALVLEDGTTKESDTDHTVMLAWIACAYADQYAPHLDLGLVAQFALIHDMVEVYAGDTPSFQINTDQKNRKEKREAAALKRLQTDFDQVYPWIGRTITLYEDLSIPEARYIKTMDKIMPKIVQAHTKCATYKKWGKSQEDLIKEYAKQRQECLETFAHDQPQAMELWDAIAKATLEAY